MKLKSAASKRTFYILIPFVLPLCMIAMGILLMVNENFFNKVFMILGSILAFVGLIKIILYAAQKTATASQKPLFSAASETEAPEDKSLHAFEMRTPVK